MTIGFPGYQHPSTVLFIDDDQSFLNNIILGLSADCLYEFCHNPEQADRLLDHSEELSTSLQHLLDTDSADFEEIDGTGQELLSMNLSPIVQQIYNAKRFNRISVMVVDYLMPRMNGLSLCQKFKNHPVKKLMITGKADYNLAVDAFNEGAIDHFLMKDDVDFFERLNAAIHDLQKQFFIDATHNIMENLSVFTPFCLTNSSIIKFLERYFNQANIVEYYLIDTSGSLLLIDDQGELSFFVVRNDAEMNNICQLAVDNDAPEQIIRRLRSREDLLFLYGEKANALGPQHWQRYLTPAHQLKADGKHFYYAVVKEVDLYISRQNIQPWCNQALIL